MEMDDFHKYFYKRQRLIEEGVKQRVQRYMPMFKKFLSDDNEIYGGNITRIIEKAVRELKKDNVVVWLLYRFREDIKEANIENVLLERTYIKYKEHINSLQHYLSLPIPKIQNFNFNHELSIYEVADIFRGLEDEWKAGRAQWIDITENIRDGDLKELIKFPDGFVWFDLGVNFCRIEGEAMGHCGNSAEYDYSDSVLSLRKVVKEGGRIMSRPSLTFILNDNSTLGEMKGRANEKPNPKYHPYIMKLLLLKNRDGGYLIKHIAGGGYAPEGNFDILDLSERDRHTLFTLRPELKSFKYRYDVGEIGIDDIENAVAKIFKTDETNVNVEGATIKINEAYPDLEALNNDNDMDWPENLARYIPHLIGAEFWDYYDDMEMDSEEVKENFEAYLSTNTKVRERIQEFADDIRGEKVELDWNDTDSIYDLIDDKYGLGDAVRTAISGGYNAGSEAQIYKKVKETINDKLLAHTDDDNIPFRFTLEDDLSISMWTDFDNAFDIIDNEIDPRDGFSMDESGDISYREDFYDFSVEAAIEQFLDLFYLTPH